MSAALVAALTAHRAAGSSEHDPVASGKIHGYCVVCLVPFPCEVAQVAFDAVKDAKAAPGADARERIATHALQGLLGKYGLTATPRDLAADSRMYADALLAELAKTSPAAAATPPAADVARLERALLHATSPCAGAGPMEMRAGEPYEPACEDCKEVGEVVDGLRKRREAQRA